MGELCCKFMLKIQHPKLLPTIFEKILNEKFNFQFNEAHPDLVMRLSLTRIDKCLSQIWNSCALESWIKFVTYINLCKLTFTI